MIGGDGFMRYEFDGAIVIRPAVPFTVDGIYYYPPGGEVRRLMMEFICDAAGGRAGAKWPEPRPSDVLS